MKINIALKKMLDREVVAIHPSYSDQSMDERWLHYDDAIIQHINLDKEATLFSEEIGDLIYDIPLKYLV